MKLRAEYFAQKYHRRGSRSNIHFAQSYKRKLYDKVKGKERESLRKQQEIF